jgi:hypothetical protein
MAHFAQVDENNMVTNVIVVDNDKLLLDGIESEQVGKDFIASIGLEGNWIQTSYNRKFRGSFAGIGAFYLPEEDIFTNLQGKSNWLKLAHDREPNILNQKSILVDGFPRSGNVFLSYLLAFGFKTCEQRTGYKAIHDLDSIKEGPSNFDVVVVPVRNPEDSIKSAVAYFNYDLDDDQKIFTLASDNLEWMKTLKENKNNICIIDFSTLISDTQSIVNKVAKVIKVLPSEFTDQEVIDRMNEDGMSLNLPNETTSNSDINLSNPLLAEVITEATAIYNEIIG